MAILQQGQQYQGGTVQFDSATGKPLAQGQTTVENKDLGAITTSSLAPNQPFTPAITQPYTAPIVAPLTAPKLDLTTQEQGALDQVSPYQQLIDQLSGSTSEIAQKSFRKQQSESMGLNAANNLSQSLYDKSQSLDLRSQAIQAQKQADIQGLQNTAQQGGANVTKGGLAPQQRAIETRANQQELANTLDKLDNAVSYYASIGQVRQAQQKVDQAVDAEFTPKLLALDTAQRNLASLLKSPNLTAAQEKLALNRQAELTAQQDAIKEAAQLKKDTGDARIKALTNNPNMTPFAHDLISAAQSPEEVAQLVNHFGLSSLSQQEKFSQDLQTAKFKQDEQQFGMNYALEKQKLAEDKRQFDLKQSQGNDSILSVNEAQALGVPYGTTQSQAMAMGKTPTKPATAVQETTALYANRLEQAGQILDTLDNYAMNANPVSYKLQANLPDVLNTLKSGDFQSVDQAQRNFVNAVLRRESGAVISPSEFDNAKKQYFAQPGDTAETVAQKKANRDLVVQGFIQGAGSAYVPIAATAKKVTAGGKEWEVGKIYNDGTSNWTVDASGKWTKQ